MEAARSVAPDVDLEDIAATPCPEARRLSSVRYL
jgi:hypothetical protein